MRKTCVIVIDEEAIFKEIQERKPASIAINGPDGMLPAVQTTASNITKKFGIPTYVLADTTWGSCDGGKSSRGGCFVQRGAYDRRSDVGQAGGNG